MAINLLFLLSFHRPFRSSPQTLMGLQTTAWKPLAFDILWPSGPHCRLPCSLWGLLYLCKVSKTLPDGAGGGQSSSWPLFGQVCGGCQCKAMADQDPALQLLAPSPDHEQCYSQLRAGEQSHLQNTSSAVTPESQTPAQQNGTLIAVAVTHLGVTYGSLGPRDSAPHWTCCARLFAPLLVAVQLHFLAFHIFHMQQPSFHLSKSTLGRLSVFSAFSSLWCPLRLQAEGNTISITVSFLAG